MEGQGGETLYAIAAAILEESAGRQAVVFCANVNHAQLQAAAINDQREGTAVAIYGAMEPEARERAEKRFKAGDVQILVNVDVATEGFDHAPIAVVAICRPCKSRSRFAQMVGRGTRPLKGLVDGVPTAALRRAAIASSAKPECVILGFVGELSDLKLFVNVDDLLAGPEDGPEIVARARELEKDEAETERLKRAKAQLEAEKHFFEEEESLRRTRIEVKARYEEREIDPFTGNPTARFSGTVEKPKAKAGGDLSVKQAKLLISFGVAPETVAAYGRKQAHAVLNGYRDRDAVPDFRLLRKVPKHLEWLIQEPEASVSR
jgi:superfamily II DNA or RNA helicase